jgi:hypothetical protein
MLRSIDTRIALPFSREASVQQARRQLSLLITAVCESGAQNESS